MEASVRHQKALLAAHLELEDIALSDAQELLEAVNEEYAHKVKKSPALAQKYPMLAAFFKARGDAISEGMARASKERKVAEAVTADEGDGESDA